MPLSPWPGGSGTTGTSPGIVQLRLPKGKSVLTVHILTAGQMNLATLTSRKSVSHCESYLGELDP